MGQGGAIRRARLWTGAAEDSQDCAGAVNNGTSIRARRLSSARAGKILEQGRRLRLADAGIDFRTVMTARRGEEPDPAVDRATLGIGGAVINAAEAGERDGARTHGAGLERDMEVAFGEPLAAERERGGPDRDYLAMGGRVAVGHGAIGRLRDHLAVAHYHAPYRHLA